MWDCRCHEQVLQCEINAMIDEQMIVRLDGKPYPLRSTHIQIACAPSLIFKCDIGKLLGHVCFVPHLSLMPEHTKSSHELEIHLLIEARKNKNRSTLP